jgi:hypothetical protein
VAIGRLVCSIPQASSDGKYYAAYPNGDKPGGLPAIVQQANAEWPGQNTASPPYNSQSLTRTISLASPITVGNSLVIFAAQYNLGGAGSGFSIADDLGNSYPAYTRKIDNDDPSANMSLYVLVLPRITVGGTVTFTATFGQVEWQALFPLELSGLAASPILDSAGNVQTATTTAADFLTTGNLVCGANPGIMLALSLNGTDQNAANSGGVGSPNAGTGFTAINSGIINWHGVENSFVGPACQPEYLTSSNLGTRAATFTSKKAAESYVQLGIALKAA